MIEDLIDIDKKTLEEYYDRLLRIDKQFKYLQLRMLWDFIHENESFKQICESLRSNDPNYQLHTQANGLVEYGKPFPLFVYNHVKRVNLTYFILEDILKPNREITVMSQIGRNFAPNKEGSEESFFALFNALFLEPFIYFILNKTQKPIWALGILQKYKHRTEWFNKEKLNSIATIDSSKTEDSLKSNLYKYLFDKGVELFIEPSSPSGEIDFIGSQKNTKEKLLVEGKVFDGANRGKNYIIKGIFQLLTYIKENNEMEGYLVIYSITPKILSFKFNSVPNIFPYCNLDNKRIYFVIVDIYLYETTASKRGKQEFIEITDSDLSTLL
jgi:hypothetical protein